MFFDAISVSQRWQSTDVHKEFNVVMNIQRENVNSHLVTITVKKQTKKLTNLQFMQKELLLRSAYAKE